MKAMKKSNDDSFLQYPNEIIKTPALRKSRYIGSFQHHNNCNSKIVIILLKKIKKQNRLDKKQSKLLKLYIGNTV